jgi:hypothetical protein
VGLVAFLDAWQRLKKICFPSFFNFERGLLFFYLFSLSKNKTIRLSQRETCSTYLEVCSNARVLDRVKRGKRIYLKSGTYEFHERTKSYAKYSSTP